jgi:hemolysin activation/secretion protein
LYGGKTYFSISGAMNAGGSSQADLESVRTGAKKNYFLSELQFARLQPILLPWRSDDADDNKFFGKEDWTLFLKFNAQFTGDALIPSEQKTIGGMETVRGYDERIFQGDNGINATLSLRTPMITDLVHKVFSRYHDRLQFLFFFDYGWVEVVKPQIGYEDSVYIYSIGPGLRYSIGTFLSARFDYGFPLREVKDDDGSVIAGDEPKISFRLQLQF